MQRKKERSIGDILTEFFSSPDIAKKVAEGMLPSTWREVVGPAIAEQTLQVRCLKGVMYVHVASSVVRSELMRRRRELVFEINRATGQVVISDIIIQ